MVYFWSLTADSEMGFSNLQSVQTAERVGEVELTKSSQQNWKKNTAVLAYFSFGEQLHETTSRLFYFFLEKCLINIQSK